MTTIRQIKREIKEIEEEGRKLRIYDFRATRIAYLQGKLEVLKKQQEMNK